MCENKCDTCEYSPDNCARCKGDRINAPICECDKGTYEHTEL